MKRIRVDAERRYEVLIGRDLLGDLAEAVSGATGLRLFTRMQYES